MADNENGSSRVDSFIDPRSPEGRRIRQTTKTKAEGKAEVEEKEVSSLWSSDD